MTPFRLASLVLLVALGMLAVLLFRSGGEAPPQEVVRLSASNHGAAEPLEAPLAGVTRDVDTSAHADSSASAPTEASASSLGALRVRALDHEGRPLASARFAVYVARAWKERREYADPLWKAEADAEGRASWPEAHLKLAEHAAEGGLVVRLDEFLPYVEPLAVASAEVLAQEQVLRAPPFGRLVVRVLTPLEEPVEKGFVRLVAWTGRGVGPLGPEQRDHQQGMPIERGVAHFDFVGLGVPLHLTAYMLGGPQVGAEVSALHVAGEERTVVARLGSDRVLLRLRVLDEEGRPSLVDSHLAMSMHMRGGFSTTGGALTDAESVLWLELPNEIALPAELEIALSGSGNQQIGNANVKAHVAQDRGLIDLGDAILRRGPLAVAGRVLRPDGSPAVGADVRASWTSATRVGLTNDTPSVVLRIEDVAGRFTWHVPRERATAKTEVKIEAALGERERPKLVARTQRVALGTADVELRLEELGTISATWREGSPWLPHDFEAILEPEDPASPASIQRGGTIHPGGIDFAPQLAGRTTLRLRAHRATVLVLPDLLVRAGEACDDPRLRDIDLSEKVTSLTYELVNPSGQQGRPRGRLYARPSGESKAPWVTRDFWERQPRIVLPRGRYDVAILAAGARLVRFSEVEQGQRVELESELPVVLALEGRADGLADGEHLRARFELALDGILLQADATRFDTAGEARVLLPAPGRYRVTWLREKDRGTEIDAHLLEAEAGSVDVEEGASEQRAMIPAPRPSGKR